MPIKKYLCLAAVLILLAVSGCAGEKSSGMKIGLLPNVESLPFYAALEKGYLNDEGINVELVVFESAVERDSAIQAGEVDGALGDILAVAALNNSGAPVKIVSLALGETGREGRFAVLSSPESGITRPDQLINIPVSISTNSIIEYVTDNLLKDAGLKPDEIKKEAIPKIPVRYNLLMENKIKAACLPDPQAALAESKGARLVLDDTSSNLSQTVIYFSDKYLDKNSKSVQKFLNAYARAAKDINDNPAAFKDLLIEKARVPKEAVEVFTMDHYPAPRLPEKEQVDRVVSWMSSKGLIKTHFTYEDLARTDLLPTR
ncbi:ABC transporter substrate-binding protein [Pelotomaculum propionicicum]|uniref:ABC transporter substrate-binding protein n=1 Tax=Pelotomaculum propionicicum TaxID=258475 RepID=UPI003B76AEF0